MQLTSCTSALHNGHPVPHIAGEPCPVCAIIEGLQGRLLIIAEAVKPFVGWTEIGAAKGGVSVEINGGEPTVVDEPNGDNANETSGPKTAQVVEQAKPKIDLSAIKHDIADKLDMLPRERKRAVLKGRGLDPDLDVRSCRLRSKSTMDLLAAVGAAINSMEAEPGSPESLDPAPARVEDPAATVPAEVTGTSEPSDDDVPF